MIRFTAVSLLALWFGPRILRIIRSSEFELFMLVFIALLSDRERRPNCPLEPAAFSASSGLKSTPPLTSEATAATMANSCSLLPLRPKNSRGI